MKKNIDDIIENMDKNESNNAQAKIDENGDLIRNFASSNDEIGKTIEYQIASVIHRLFKYRFVYLKVPRKQVPEGFIILFKQLNDVWIRDNELLGLRRLLSSQVSIWYTYLSNVISFNILCSLVKNTESKDKIMSYFMKEVPTYSNIHDMTHIHNINNSNTLIWLGPKFGPPFGPPGKKVLNIYVK